jgi:thiol-disulfide isomerase/thioredoxin
MRPGRRRGLALVAIGAGAAATGALIGAFVVQSGSGATRLLGARFVDLEGRPHRLLDWGGKVLLCNFWATWCAPCREEIPLLVAAKHKYAAMGLEIIGIGIDQAAKLRDFAANFRVNYPILVSGPEAIDLLRALGNAAGALPYSVLVDRAGRIAFRRLGAFRKDELDGILAGMLD